MSPPKLLLLEPFWGGSHRHFAQIVTQGIAADWTTLQLPAQHWKWRMRASAVHWALQARDVLDRPWDGILASSYLPLAELRGLVPSLSRVPALLYFHENQFAFPSGPTVSAEEQVRDLHYGFTQLTSALAATVCAFNSHFNLRSFLDEADRLLRLMPRPRPRGWVQAVASRSQVLPVPLALPDETPSLHPRQGPPRILWNHRWEHDKRPEAFFDAMQRLDARGLEFRLLVTGQRFRHAPDCFSQAETTLAHRIDHWGFAPSREDYLTLLRQADIAVSTAGHEFFGVAMLEATHMGARPLVPDRLAYPEIYPSEYRYADDDALVDELERLLTASCALRSDRTELTQRYGGPALDDLRKALVSLVDHDAKTI